MCGSLFWDGFNVDDLNHSRPFRKAVFVQLSSKSCLTFPSLSSSTYAACSFACFSTALCAQTVCFLICQKKNVTIPQSLLKQNHVNICNIKPAQREAPRLFVFFGLDALPVITSLVCLVVWGQWLTFFFSEWLSYIDQSKDHTQKRDEKNNITYTHHEKNA